MGRAARKVMMQVTAAQRSLTEVLPISWAPPKARMRASHGPRMVRSWAARVTCSMKAKGPVGGGAASAGHRAAGLEGLEVLAFIEDEEVAPPVVGTVPRGGASGGRPMLMGPPMV